MPAQAHQNPALHCSTWRRRGSRPVVTIEQPDQDRQQLLDTITRLERQKRVLAAVVRILLSLLRAFGISLAGERLPEGDAKAGILRAIATSKPFLPLAVTLRIVRLEPGRYHAWNRRASGLACGLDDRSSCPRTSPSQLTPTEMANIKDMVLAPENRHMVQHNTRCPIQPFPAKPRTRCTSARRSTCPPNWPRPAATPGRSGLRRTGR
jgi:hypothetical protein